MGMVGKTNGETGGRVVGLGNTVESGTQSRMKTVVTSYNRLIHRTGIRNGNFLRGSGKT